MVKPANYDLMQIEREEQEFQKYYAHEKEIYMGLASSSSEDEGKSDGGGFSKYGHSRNSHIEGIESIGSRRGKTHAAPIEGKNKDRIGS